MEKEVEAVLELFRRGVTNEIIKFAEADESRAMALMFQAMRRISNAMPFAEGDALTSHPQLLKMLMLCSPMNGQAVDMLLETLLDKFKDREYMIFSMWKLCESIAELDIRTAGSILTRKIIDFDEPVTKKPINLSKVQQCYMMRHLWSIKRTVVQLLPQLFTIIHQRSPTDVKEKMFIFRLLRTDCRNPELALQICRTADALKLKFNLQPQARKSKAQTAVRTMKRRMTTRKLPPQNNFSVDRALIEQYTRYNKGEELLGVLKADINVEAFLSYIVRPEEQLIDERVWSGITFAQARNQRSMKALQMLRDLKFFRRLVATFPQIFNVFFNYLQSKRASDLDFNGIKQLLEVFMRDDAAVVTTLLIRSELLENFFPELEDKVFYEFLVRAIGLYNVRQQSALNLKKVYYNYMERCEFFQLLINNMHCICHDGLATIKDKYLEDMEQAVKRYYTDRRKTKTVVLSTPAIVQVNSEDPPPNKTTFFQPRSSVEVVLPPPLTTSRTDRAKISKQTITEQCKQYTPPYAVAPYRGYYSTAPVLNFFSVEQENVDISQQEWHLATCSLYHEILQSVVGCPFEVPYEIIRAVLPDSYQLINGMFLNLKKYTALLPTHPDNSAKRIVKVLNILLENPLFEHMRSHFKQLCSKHIHTLYPIICKLFQQNKEPVYHQTITIVKVIGEDALDAVTLLSNFLKTIKPVEKQAVFDSIQEDLWFILMLWFFDCSLNNLYQTLFYDIVEQLCQFASESLLVKVLFKYNMVSCLHNAYNDVVRQRVLVVEWHMQTFYFYIRKLHSLIDTTLQARRELTVLRQNLSKTVAWHFLSNKIRLGLYSTREPYDSLTASSNNLADSPRNSTYKTLVAPSF